MTKNRGFTPSILLPDDNVETLTVKQGQGRILEWLGCVNIRDSLPLTMQFAIAAENSVSRNLAIVGPHKLIRVFAGKVSCQIIEDDKKLREAFGMKEGEMYTSESQRVLTPDDLYKCLNNTRIAWQQVPSHMRFQIA